MPTAYIDHTDTVECKEVNGAIRSLTRIARVVNMIDTDYTVLWTALNNIGVPGWGAQPPDAISNPFSAFYDLLLVDRSAKIVDKDNGTVDVTLVYQHKLDGPFQNLTNAAVNGGVLYGKVRASLQQKQTNLDSPINGELIVVSYTYPKNANSPHAGKTVKQVGVIDVPRPQKNYSLSGFIQTTTPWTVADSMLGHLNQVYWAGGDPRTWLCTEVSYEYLRLNFYQFAFEFQHDFDGWDQTAIFIDDQTGKPPADLTSIAVIDAQQIALNPPGTLVVEYILGADFAQILGAMTEWMENDG